MDPQEIEELIRHGLDGAHVEVRTDGQGHYEALVVAEQFAGKRTLARHQLVYATLGERVGREIHALQLRTLTPEESGSA
ncbi:MAG: BolA/IbaG family iron-sulfur metabolism protein [Gammaproteobacteria bacterium]|jgi:acid stress-induced BolA-like protein IbaG/YrbA